MLKTSVWGREKKFNHCPDKWTKEHSLNVGGSKISESFQWQRENLQTFEFSL